MVKYKRKINLFFRNKSITLLLILGLIISYFIVINGVSMINEISKKQINNKKEAYENEKKFLMSEGRGEYLDDIESVKYKNTLIDMFTNLDMGKGNLIIEGHIVFIGNSLRGVYSDIIVSLEDKLDKKIVNGRMPTEDELKNKENVVLISTEIQEFVDVVDGIDTILIDNETYKVVGVFKTNDITEGRADIIMFMDTFSDEYIEEICDNYQVYEICFGGNITEEDYDALIEKIINAGQIVEEDYDDETQENKNREKFNNRFMIILFCFSMINCMVITNVWINSRFRELLIRKTMGYSMIQIVKLVITDLFKYSIVSVIIAAIVQFLTNNILIKNSVAMEYTLDNLLYLVLAIIVIIMTSIIIPMIKLGKILPSKK